MIEVTVRCGCTRTMLPDTYAGPSRYRCSCGARITITGLPKLDARHCPLPKGSRICNGPKDPDLPVCEPCSVMIAGLALADPEQARQLGTRKGSVDFYQARRAEAQRQHEEFQARVAQINNRDLARKCAVVYYCETRPGVVKIGTTTQLGVRMDAFRVPATSVLAAEPGYFKLENLRHKQFADLRIDRAREDFHFGDALREHVDKVASIHGDPFELVTRIREMQEELAQDPAQSYLLQESGESR